MHDDRDPARAALLAAATLRHPPDELPRLLSRAPQLGPPRDAPTERVPLRRLWLSELASELDRLPPAWQPAPIPESSGMLVWLRQLVTAWRRIEPLHRDPLLRRWQTIRPAEQPPAIRTLGAWVWTQAAHAMSRRRLERSLARLGDDARLVIELLTRDSLPDVPTSLRKTWAATVLQSPTPERPRALGPATCGQRLLAACLDLLRDPALRRAAARIFRVADPDAKTVPPLALNEDGWRPWNQRLARVLEAAGDAAALLEDRDDPHAGRASTTAHRRRHGPHRAAVSDDATEAGNDRGSRAVASGPAGGSATGTTRGPAGA